MGIAPKLTKKMWKEKLYLFDPIFPSRYKHILFTPSSKEKKHTQRKTPIFLSFSNQAVSLPLSKYYCESNNLNIVSFNDQLLSSHLFDLYSVVLIELITFFFWKQFLHLHFSSFTVPSPSLSLACSSSSSQYLDISWPPPWIFSFLSPYHSQVYLT